MNALRRVAVLPIRFYQRYLSPLKPPTCRFEPTCSAYAYGAILRHGFVKGWLLAVWRILRCQPFSEGGWDPVPDVGRWRADRAVAPGEPSDADTDSDTAPDADTDAGSRDQKRG